MLLLRLKSEGVGVLEVMKKCLRPKQTQSGETIERSLPRRTVPKHVSDGLQSSPVASIERITQSKRRSDSERQDREQDNSGDHPSPDREEQTGEKEAAHC